VAGRRLLTLADDLDNLVTNGREVYVETLESLGRDALTLVEQTEQDVLGTYVVVVEKPCLFLGQYYDPPCTIGKPFKHSILLSLTYAILPPGRDLTPRRSPARLSVIPSSTMEDLQSLIHIPRIWEQLGRVEERLLEASTADDPYLTKIAQHLLLAGGKRFRPLLALLAAEFGTGLSHKPVEAGVAVELIHLGSLYHDDVIDESSTRRGAASANANWENTVAILAGDFLMARASEVAATHLSQESVRLLASTYADLVEGQTRELQLEGDLSHSIDEYNQVIDGKTASLIRTSARLGAMASDADETTVDALSTWAWELGMVFQIADDALDLVADEETIGKPAGSDIREGTFTAPVLMAVNGPDGDRVRELLNQDMPYSDEVVAEVISLVRAGKFVDAALLSATERLVVAGDALRMLPDGEAREILERLGGFLVDRVEAART
jgi:heptaprenyl diphosphate synthase